MEKTATVLREDMVFFEKVTEAITEIGVVMQGIHMRICAIEDRISMIENRNTTEPGILPPSEPTAGG